LPTFLKIKNAWKIKKTFKNVKNVTKIKTVKNVFYIYGSGGCIQGRDGVEKGVTAGRLRSSSLRQTLVDKTAGWLRRHDPASWRGVPATETDVDRQLDGPGVAVFAHRDRPCFRLVARAADVFTWSSEALRGAFEGSNPDPLSALLVTSLSQAWDFYFVPVLPTGQFDYVCVR